MEMNIFFLFCVAVSVSGQFVETEYRLDSVPLPIRRRINAPEYEIQPSIGREIEARYEPVRANQGRRHIDDNRRNHNGQINRNTHNFNVEPSVNIYEATIYDNVRQEHSEGQFNPQVQQENQARYIAESNIQSNNRREENALKTNVDNQQNHRVQEEIRQNGQQTSDNTRNIDTTSQTANKQPNYGNYDNTDFRNDSTDQQTQNIRTNNENNNRHAEASLRAIDSNSHKQQNVDSANNRNYNTKPSRQHTDVTKQNDNRNFGAQTTQETIKADSKYVTGSTKSTEDNELTSKPLAGGRSGSNDDDKWIWSSAGGKTTKTTVIPTSITPLVDDRAAFNGDKCPTGQVRFNNMCVDID